MILDMSRGRPGAEQVRLSSPITDCLKSGDDFSVNGIDCRNYGGLEGIEPFRAIVGDILGVDKDLVIAGGNSSLEMMFDCVAAFCCNGVSESAKPWKDGGTVKFLCPAPGYDRHFTICDYFGIEMIPVKMTETGPDMKEVERLAAGDERVKGIWCVPVFSNPTGCVYSDKTIQRIASMQTAADDFRVFWDNAYAVHAFNGANPNVLNVLDACGKAGFPDRVVEFMSFSKISLGGAGVASIACSAANRAYLLKRLAVKTVGPDKVNQLRHVKFFKSTTGVYAHMRKMADVIRPKFNAVESALSYYLTGTAQWTKPDGGYFISVELPDGFAKRTVAACAEKGLVITPAGAPFPGGYDPDDSNIRLAPTALALRDLERAAEIFCKTVAEELKK